MRREPNTPDRGKVKESGETNSIAHQWCWGTVHSPGPESPGARPTWTPLVVEMVTASAVLLELWDHLLTLPQRVDIAEGLGSHDERDARLAAAFLAGASRVGRACPVHMVAFGVGLRSGPAVEAARAAWRDQAVRAGLPLPPAGTRVRHAEAEHLTAAVLPRLTGCDCEGYVDGERCRDDAHQGLHTLAHALHRYQEDVLHADTVAKAYRATGGAPWDRVRAALLDEVAGYVGMSAVKLPALIGGANPRRLTAFTALVAQSAALSQDESLCGVAPPFGTPDVVAALAQKHAAEQVERMRIAG